ncbi:MAG: lipopolysaccharide assembly protein LapA domain-containing protein [Nitrospirota bacterium]|jgi:uncharacterized integral membrane protein
MVKTELGKASFRTIAIIVIVFLFTSFMFQNTEVVRITFLFWKFELSRVLLLLASLLVGFLVGLLAGWEWFWRKPKQKP